MIDTAAILYGKGVFTTVRVVNSSPLFWEKHWRRLSANAEKIGLDISQFDEKSVVALLSKTVERDALVNGRVRITLSDITPSPIWSNSSDAKTEISIITGILRPISNEFKLTVSPYHMNSKSPLSGVKSCNYLENILALNEAASRGFHEAICLNEHNEITSGCMSNVFWTKNKKLYTPKLKTGCLGGTTREYVLETVECKEVMAELDELQTADEIFLTSAGIGIVQVAEFETKHLTRKPHPILHLLNNHLRVF